MARLAVVTSHPIQYHAPLFRALAQRVDLEVFYCHQQDAAGQAAAGFGVAFEWDVPLLDGYRHHFLRNVSGAAGVDHFGGCDTPDIHEQLRAGRFDACLITGWYLKSYLQALVACRRLGVPALSRGDSQLATRRASVWGVAKHVPYRVLLSQYDAHLYVGTSNHAYLRHFGVPESRLFFTPHFVDNTFFSTRARQARADGSRERVRREAGAGAEDCVCLFVGKFIDKKRPLDFVRAIAVAARLNPRIRGIMVGSGPLESAVAGAVRATAAPVTCVGFRNQTELPAHFAAADLLVLASDAGETWGLVVNEAMACGVPAILSDACGSAPDLVVEGKTGYTFPCGEVGALADALMRLQQQLVHSRATVSADVCAHIADYSCDRAVRGIIEAIEAVRRR